MNSPEIYLSVVVPSYNEVENLTELIERIDKALQPVGQSYEIVMVDDGSTDGSVELLQKLRSQGRPWLRILVMQRNTGQTAAMDAGFKNARGELIATLDADLQNDPAEIPRLLGYLDQCDMVNGWRKKRNDNLRRRVSTKIANGIRNWLSDEQINDSACSLKIYKRGCLAGLTLYKGMHRFMPTLVKMRGYRVLEIPVSHHPRLRGTAKYGMWNRMFRAFVDLLAVRWMKNRFLRYDCRELKIENQSNCTNSLSR